MAFTNDDLFPPSPRVIYARAPLMAVACEFRFPRLLKIQSGNPVEFQERIRKTFPLLDPPGTPFQVPAPLMPPGAGRGVPPEVLQFIGAQMGRDAFQFHTEDRCSTITLRPESLGFVTSAYAEWPQFREHMRLGLDALVQIYAPTFFTRLGLRYTNAINRESIGIRGRPWSALLRPPLLGELNTPVFEENCVLTARQLRVMLPDRSGAVTLNHGFADVAGREGVTYLIDLDFSQEARIDIENAEATLNHFNQLAGRAFRWAITDELAHALNTKPVAKPADANSDQLTAAS
jgi:uncharacterized protein (TIGR04255 family)